IDIKPVLTCSRNEDLATVKQSRRIARLGSNHISRPGEISSGWIVQFRGGQCVRRSAVVQDATARDQDSTVGQHSRRMAKVRRGHVTGRTERTGHWVE